MAGLPRPLSLAVLLVPAWLGGCAATRPPLVVPSGGQVLTPAGLQVELAGLRPQALALAPNGRLLVTSGKTHELVVVDPRSGSIRQRVPLPAGGSGDPAAISTHVLEPDREGQLSYTGLEFSPDGSRIYLANVKGDVKVFAVGADDRVRPLTRFPLGDSVLPAGLAVSDDGRRLYVALSAANQLAELDAHTGERLRTWDVGFAPFGVALAAGKAYVTNWGGRRPAPDSLTGPVGRHARVRVDPVRHVASEGSVSIVDLNGNGEVREILLGLHSSAVARSPSGRFVAVANAASDTISVLDTRSDTVVETIRTEHAAGDLFGATPNALAFDDRGRTLFVCNGTHNAVAVVAFRPGRSRVAGEIPVGWFPGAVVFDAARRALYVANVKGEGVTRDLASGGSRGSNTHQYHGTLSLVPMPDPAELARMTRIVRRNIGDTALLASRLPPRPGQPPRPVPERVGEPSVFEHVVYVIKENRTYDQVLGDVAKGDGDPSLCVFGAQITPNQHAIVDEFVLLDRAYCSGILSADGHQWADSAITTDYMERSFAGFPRSYPDGMDDDDVDALAYSPAGFLWDNAIAHGKTLRVHGEFAITEKRWKDPHRTGEPRFADHYRDWSQGGGAIEIRSRPAIESLRPYLNTRTVGWDMDIPDQFRADRFLEELRECERKGTFPALSIVCLPNDHTSGTRAGSPTPRAQVADNDLAFGRIVEAISHSRFWRTTCIFAIEDDPQAGWDHVSGFRTTAYVVSPYTRRGAVVHVRYDQPSIVRTIELILGLPPMNRLDAAATPMTACFTDVPDWTPFVARPSNVALDEMNPEPDRIADATLRADSLASARLPLGAPDRCPEDLLNRILWRAMKGVSAPYPGGRR